MYQPLTPSHPIKLYGTFKAKTAKSQVSPPKEESPCQYETDTVTFVIGSYFTAEALPVLLP